MPLSDNYNSPPEVVNAVREYYGGLIPLDPCSNAYSTVGARANWKEDSGVGMFNPWNLGGTYAFPPTGPEWIVYATQQWLEFKQDIILLTPAATDTSVWEHCIFPHATSVCFLFGRQKFWDKGQPLKHKSNQAYVLVYFGNAPTYFKTVFQHLGAVVWLRARTP